MVHPDVKGWIWSEREGRFERRVVTYVPSSAEWRAGGKIGWKLETRTIEQHAEILRGIRKSQEAA